MQKVTLNAGGRCQEFSGLSNELPINAVNVIVTSPFPDVRAKFRHHILLVPLGRLTVNVTGKVKLQLYLCLV
jgi:hypothetical protein